MSQLYISGPPGCGKTCFLYLWARFVAILEKKRVLIVQFWEQHSCFVWIREPDGNLWQLEEPIDPCNLQYAGHAEQCCDESNVACFPYFYGWASVGWADVPYSSNVSRLLTRGGLPEVQKFSGWVRKSCISFIPESRFGRLGIWAWANWCHPLELGVKERESSVRNKSQWLVVFSNITTSRVWRSRHGTSNYWKWHSYLVSKVESRLFRCCALLWENTHHRAVSHCKNLILWKCNFVRMLWDVLVLYNVNWSLTYSV